MSGVGGGWEWGLGVGLVSRGVWTKSKEAEPQESLSRKSTMESKRELGLTCYVLSEQQCAYSYLSEQCSQDPTAGSARLEQGLQGTCTFLVLL
jgi:hypothetical protein